MRINLLNRDGFLLPTSFKYTAVVANSITVMTVKTINGSRYGYFIHIQPENIFGKWSWGRASQPPMNALWIRRSKLLIVFYFWEILISYPNETPSAQGMCIKANASAALVESVISPTTLFMTPVQIKFIMWRIQVILADSYLRCYSRHWKYNGLKIAISVADVMS